MMKTVVPSLGRAPIRRRACPAGAAEPLLPCSGRDRSRGVQAVRPHTRCSRGRAPRPARCSPGRRSAKAVQPMRSSSARRAIRPGQPPHRTGPSPGTGHQHRSPRTPVRGSRQTSRRRAASVQRSGRLRRAGPDRRAGSGVPRRAGVRPRLHGKAPTALPGPLDTSLARQVLVCPARGCRTGATTSASQDVQSAVTGADDADLGAQSGDVSVGRARVSGVRWRHCWVHGGLQRRWP